MINVKNEEQRLPEAIKYCKNVIEEFDRQIRQCDYSEDIDGHLVYEPGAYAYEKDELCAEKRKWEVLLDLLTMKPPFSRLDW